MAIKLALGVATVPASLKNGKLLIDILSNHWEIDVPIKQEYDTQLVDHDNPQVFALLSNEKTILVIRRDGTASVLHKEDRALYKNFMVEIPKELLTAEVHPGGAALYETGDKGTLLTTCIIKSKCVGIITLDSAPYSVVFDTRENYAYVTDMCLQNGVGFPALFWQDYTLVYRQDFKDAKSPVLYKIKGELIQHKSVTANTVIR